MTEKHWNVLRHRRNDLRERMVPPLEVEEWHELEALNEILHNKQLYLAALKQKEQPDEN